jgi:hypothetical protein
MTRGNKYGAKGLKTEDGYFHSQGEYRRWQELKLLERGKQIVGLKRGERHPLLVNGKTVGHYKPDYEYGDRKDEGIYEYIYEDFKGGPTHTEAAKLRIKLFEVLFNCKVLITGKRTK